MFFDWESNHGGTSNDITDNRSGTSVFQACIGRQSSQSVQWFSGFKTSRKKIFPLFYRPSIWFWLWHHKNQIKWVNLAEHQIPGPWGYHRLAEVWLDGHRKSFYKAWRRGAVARIGRCVVRARREQCGAAQGSCRQSRVSRQLALHTPQGLPKEFAFDSLPWIRNKLCGQSLTIWPEAARFQLLQKPLENLKGPKSKLDWC